MTILDRLLGRPEPTRKAVFGPGVTTIATGQPLSSLYGSTQQRMAAYLKAYRVGWFYKAESKISRDVATLKVQVMPEGTTGNNEEALVAPDLDIPFAQLGPIDQFLRLMEQPNPWETGRMLRTKTCIRRDMAGAAFWYLDGGSRLTLPSAIYGISPARMWPAENARGQRVGWVMDKDRPGGGVPFTTEEIIAFLGPSADDGYSPVGVVESVYAEVPLTERMATHTADVLSTGGRLAGMVWPKNRAVGEDEFQDILRAWRNVQSDPNAARRLLVFPEPMEYAQGAATPAEIGIPELATLNRDIILSAFPISPYMLGVPMPGGLNSAELRREEERAYQQNAIHPRAEEFEETVQTGLLARYEAAAGQTFDLELLEPNLDDAPTLLEKAGAFRSLVSIGFDAEAVVEATGLDGIKWNGLPDMLDPAKQAEMAAAAPDPTQGSRVVVRDSTPRNSTQTQQTLVGKSAGIEPDATKSTRREDVLGREVAGFHEHVRAFLWEQRSRIVERVKASVPANKMDRKAIPVDWWDGEDEDQRLRAAIDGARHRIVRGALQKAADDTGRFVLPERIERVAAGNLRAAGTRITNINEATRKAVGETLSEGLRRGYSIPQLIDGVPAEGYPGVRDAPLGNGGSAFDDVRAETIARTETMQVWNDAAVRGYGELGVREVQAIDGDKDAECASRDGRTFSVEDALGVADHPNGTLDWIPVMDTYGKSLSKGTFSFDLPTPVVHPTPVHVDAPVIDMSPFVDALTRQGEALAVLAAQVVELKTPREKVVVRDDNGRITGVRDA